MQIVIRCSFHYLDIQTAYPNVKGPRITHVNLYRIPLKRLLQLRYFLKPTQLGTNEAKYKHSNNIHY